MKYLKKFATVSQLNNWIYNNLSSYEEPNVYTIGDNEDNLKVQYNKDYTIITLDTSIQNSVTGNSKGSLWTIYNGDIYEEILLDDIKIDNPMTPLTYNDVSKGKHILKMKFKNNIIGSSAPVFYNSFVKKAKIAKNIINIGTNAFLYCNELDEIDFGNITSIGSSAFASCYKLTEIEITDSVTNISSNAFGGCTSLASISIPESVTSTGEYSIFTGCTSLGYVENGIRYVDINTSIGTEIICFEDTTLSSYTIKSGVKNISIEIPELPNATEFNIPNTVTSFPSTLDNVASILTSEQINALLAIDSNCISKSKKIELFSYIENGIKYYDDPSTGTEIVDFVDTTLTSYSIKSGVRSITKSIPVLPNAEEFIIPSTVTSYSFGVLNNIIDLFSGQELEDLFDANAISKDIILNNNLLNKSYLSQQYFSIYNSDNIDHYVKFKADGTPSGAKYFEYSKNGSTWDYIDSTNITSVRIQSHETIIIKSNIIPNTTYSTITASSGLPCSSYYISSPTWPVYSGIGLISLDHESLIPYGNIMSLLKGDNFVNTTLTSKFSFAGLFECSAIENASNIILPSNATEDCYYYMFFGCTKLNKIPELPATTLAEGCYNSMFSGCTALTVAPELPATTLANFCYNNMFYGCTSLTTTPELPATTLADYCYYSMFSKCSSLTTAPELPVTTLANNCYNSMFSGCTALTVAPELPATTLANFCYNNMFNGCTSLNYVKMLATNISASYCLNNWLKNVNSTGTFVKHIDATWSNSNVVPSGWTVENYEERPTPRELPEGYTEVKYIASTKTGGQYIDLNIKLYETLNTNYDIAIKFNIIGQGLNNSTNAPIFACQDPTGSPWPGTFIRRTASSNNVVGRYIGGTAKDNTIGQVNTIIELPVQTPPNKNVTNLSNSGKTHSYGTSLFCVFGDTNNTVRDFTEAKLYYFKLFVEGTLVRDLVPCINSSNVAGLYDVVNDVFYTSPNGAAFIYEAWAS